MFKFVLPAGKHKLETLIDEMLIEPHIDLTDAGLSRQLGIHCAPLRRRGILNILYDPVTKETVARLKIKDVTKQIRPGRNIEYDFLIEIPSPKKSKFRLF